MRFPALLVVLALIEGVAWSVVQPPLADPAEDAQTAYVQHFAETGHKPSAERGTTMRSDEQARYALINGADTLAAHGNARPPYDALQRRALAATMPPPLSVSRANGTGPNPAATSPPGLALVDAIPYRAARVVGGSFGLTLVILRIISAALFALAVWLTWLMALELFGDLNQSSGSARLAAFTVALLPGLSAQAGLVSVEPLLAVEFAATLWAALRLVRLGPSPTRAATLAVLVCAGALTDGRGLALVIPALVAGVLVARTRPARRVLLVSAGAGVGTLVVGAVAVLVLARRGSDAVYGGLLHQTLSTPRPGQFISSIWQEFLPRLPGMQPQLGITGPRNGLVAGVIDPSSVRFGAATTAIGTALFVGVIVVLLVALWRRGVRRVGAPVWLGLATTLGGLAVIVVARAQVGELARARTLGALVLPLAPMLGLAVGAATAALPRRESTWAAGAIVGALVVLQSGALLLAAGAIHA